MPLEEKVSRTEEQSPGWGLPREAPKEPWSLEQGNCWGRMDGGYEGMVASPELLWGQLGACFSPGPQS